MTIFWGLMIPFIGTAAGAACVLFVKNELKPLLQKSLLGFAAGVMVAASVWSLLIPAMPMLRWQAHLLCLSGLRCKISRKVLLYLFRSALKREEAGHSEPACSQES